MYLIQIVGSVLFFKSFQRLLTLWTQLIHVYENNLPVYICNLPLIFVKGAGSDYFEYSKNT